MTTRRLNLGNFSSNPDPPQLTATAPGDASAGTATVNRNSRVIVVVTCGANWDIDDETGDPDGIFNAHHGLHDGGDNFNSNDQSSTIFAIRSFKCVQAGVGNSFLVDIKEDGNKHRSCTATVLP